MDPINEGIKHDEGKPRFDLIDGYAMEQLAWVLTFGAEKYEPHNWRKGIKFSRLIAAAERHLNAIKRGEDFDNETKLPHAAHAMCCLMFLTWMQQYRPGKDDRWTDELYTGLRIEGCDEYGQKRAAEETTVPKRVKEMPEGPQLGPKMRWDGTTVVPTDPLPPLGEMDALVARKVAELKEAQRSNEQIEGAQKETPHPNTQWRIKTSLERGLE
jgi:hypothetical protein